MNVDFQEWYSAKQLFDLGVFPWIHSMPTLTRWIDADMAHENHLRATRRGNGKGARYLIQGANVISFLANIEDGGILMGNLRGDDGTPDVNVESSLQKIN